MQLLKLTVFSSLFIVLLLTIASCEKDSEKKKGGRLYVKSGIPVTGAQAVPASNSTGTGALSVNYSRDTRTLSYTFNWTGLKDTITGAAIHGPAPAGYASATIRQALTGFVADIKTNQKNFPYQGGSYTGSVFVDDVVIKEQDLLNQLYYISVRTKAFPSTGEVRAQIVFQ